MAPAKTQPALLGGVVIGVLSALPFINIANCCCAWILFGGGLAAYLMQQNHPEPIQVGDGAIVGLLAGIVGAFVWLIISIPLNMAMAPFQAGMMQRMMENSGNLPPEFRSIFENASAGAAVGVGTAFFFFIMLFVGGLVAMLGGLFGALMFRKTPPAIPPPIPPANF
jgi:hypothetical protein